MLAFSKPIVGNCRAGAGPVAATQAAVSAAGQQQTTPQPQPHALTGIPNPTSDVTPTVLPAPCCFFSVCAATCRQFSCPLFPPASQVFTAPLTTDFCQLSHQNPSETQFNPLHKGGPIHRRPPKPRPPTHPRINANPPAWQSPRPRGAARPARGAPSSPAPP